MLLFKSQSRSLNRESLTVVEQYFPRYALQEQDILGRKESVQKVLALVPEDILFHSAARLIANGNTIIFWIGLNGNLCEND